MAKFTQHFCVLKRKWLRPQSKRYRGLNCWGVTVSKVIRKTSAAVSLQHDRVAYSDSTIVLSWLRSHPSRWKTFIANRVQEIQNILPAEHWFHVRSEDNIADLPTRPVIATEVLNNSFWWNGPSWLHSDSFDNLPFPGLSESPPEERKKSDQAFVNVVSTTSTTELYICSKVSSYPKLIRITAYVLRFINGCRKKPNYNSPWIGAREFKEANAFIIKHIQAHSFPEEIKRLKSGQPVKTASTLHKLNPILDKFGLMRIGGRLQHAALPFETRQPIILPANHIFVKHLTYYLHKENLHWTSALAGNVVK